MDNKLSTGNNYPNSTKEPTYLIPNKQKQLSSGIQIILPNLQLEKIDLNKNIRELLEINKWHTTEDEWHLTEDEWHLTEDESSWVAPPTDILAFYKPFHNNDSFPWGIYIKESGIVILANVLKILLKDKKIDIDFSNTAHKIFIINMVLMKLHLHESYHHAVEVALTSPIVTKQITVDNGTYLKYEKIKKGDKDKQETEEKFCNSFVAHNKKEFICKYNELNSSQSPLLLLNAYPAVDEFMKFQPPGYRDFTQKLSNVQVAKNILETMGVNPNSLGKLKGDPAKLIAKTITNTMQEQNRREIPHYLIHYI